MTDEQEFEFHEDPAVEQGLVTINDKAAFYRLAHGILTGKFDQDFAAWKQAERSKVDETAVENLPDFTDLLEWVFTSATTNDLFLFQDRLNELVKTVLAELFGRYAEKDVRGMLPAGYGLAELGETRKDLINVLNGTLLMAKNGMLNPVMADPKTLEALPNVKKRKPFGDGLVWDFPDAPSPEKTNNGPVTVTPGTSNYRAHNTTTKIVVNGELPTDHPAKLGDACEKYFEKNPQDVGRLFEGWHSDYCQTDKEPPAKVIERNGVRYWFTIVG